MNLIEIVVGAMGGATAGIAVVIFLGKALISNTLAKDLESHKAKLQRQSDTTIEELKKDNANKLEVLKSELEEERTAKAARRDYEYEARKRLYREYEPLLFQFVERANDSLYRIYSIARSSKIGNLQPDGSGWLESEGYFLSSTIYNLLSPLAVFKLIQRRMTLIDLRLDPSIQSHYEISKWLNISYTDDFEFARANPKLEYDPHCTDWKKKRKENQSVYWRQGIPIGRLDTALESMIFENGATQRIMSFGEFEAALNDSSSGLSSAFDTVVDIFTGFHPKSRPVLWRILVTQAYILSAVTRRKYFIRAHDKAESIPWVIERPKKRDQFDWRVPGQEDDESISLVEPFLVAEKYLERHLKDYISLSEKPISGTDGV